MSLNQTGSHRIRSCISGLMSRVFANGPVQSQVKSYQRLKIMVLDIAWLNTQHYKVEIKGKVEQSRNGVTPSPTPLGHPRLKSPTYYNYTEANR